MTNRTYLISGAGAGIGKAIALQIAQEDPLNQVLLLGRNLEKLETTRRSLPNWELHKTIVADLSNPALFQQSIHNANLEETNLCGIIANAGIGGENHYGKEDRWNEIIETNLSGTYRFIQESLPALRRSREPHRNIIIISSILARIGVPHYSALRKMKVQDFLGRRPHFSIHRMHINKSI